MPAGAVHPNTGNFTRVPRLSIVHRVRKLVDQKAYEKRPDWLEFVERAPPMELINLKLRDIRITSPYFSMVEYVVRKFPDMRFQDCFVDGNDWSKGNDRFRADHPAMQFVARQLQLMNEGKTTTTRKEAFERTKQEFLGRRVELERMQKLNLALAQNNRVVPAFESVLFTAGSGVARQRAVELEVAHLNHIRRKLRMLRKQIEPHDKRRMSAKEVALDIELERTSLLPRMAQTPYSKPHAIEQRSQEGIDEVDFSHHSVKDKKEDEEEQEPMLSSNVFEPSSSSFGRKPPRPTEVSIDDFNDDHHASEQVWKANLDVVAPVFPADERKSEAPFFVKAKPAFTLSRPDKLTVRAILAKKQKEEVQRRIGKEPGAGSGEEDLLDFEDFINKIQQSKNK